MNEWLLASTNLHIILVFLRRFSWCKVNTSHDATWYIHYSTSARKSQKVMFKLTCDGLVEGRTPLKKMQGCI